MTYCGICEYSLSVPSVCPRSGSTVTVANEDEQGRDITLAPFLPVQYHFPFPTTLHTRMTIQSRSPSLDLGTTAFATIHANGDHDSHTQPQAPNQFPTPVDTQLYLCVEFGLYCSGGSSGSIRRTRGGGGIRRSEY